MTRKNRAGVAAFYDKVAELAGAMNAAQNYLAELQQKVVLIKQTLHNTAGTSRELMNRAVKAERELDEELDVIGAP